MTVFIVGVLPRLGLEPRTIGQQPNALTLEINSRVYVYSVYTHENIPVPKWVSWSGPLFRFWAYFVDWPSLPITTIIGRYSSSFNYIFWLWFGNLICYNWNSLPITALQLYNYFHFCLEISSAVSEFDNSNFFAFSVLW